MPKETVYGTGPIYGEDSSAIPIIEVRWSKDVGFVELGTRIVHRADHSNYIPTVEEDPERAGAEIRGLFMSFERSQINNLIRNLRRARDQAFGRDE